MLKHLLLPLTALVIVCADDYDHRYKEGDRVVLWVNKVRESQLLPEIYILLWLYINSVQIRINNIGEGLEGRAGQRRGDEGRGDKSFYP